MAKAGKRRGCAARLTGSAGHLRADRAAGLDRRKWRLGSYVRGMPRRRAVAAVSTVALQRAAVGAAAIASAAAIFCATAARSGEASGSKVRR